MSRSGSSGTLPVEAQPADRGERAVVVAHRGEERLRLGHLGRRDVTRVGHEAFGDIDDTLDLLGELLLLEALDQPLPAQREVEATALPVPCSLWASRFRQAV